MGERIAGIRLLGDEANAEEQSYRTIAVANVFGVCPKIMLQLLSKSTHDNSVSHRSPWELRGAGFSV